MVERNTPLKILAPANAPGEVSGLLKAGADELYCGVLSPEWYRAYTNIASINRVERRMGNLPDYSALKELVQEAHGGGSRVNLTLNALFTAPQYDLLERELDAALQCGVDALIVADPGLVLFLNRLGVQKEIHISTGGTVFNSETALFFQELGARRIILPRGLSAAELASFKARAPSLEFEVFVLNGGCMFTDGFCTFHHGLKDRHGSQRATQTALGKTALGLIYRLPARVQQAVMDSVVPLVTDNACSLRYSVQDLGRGSSSVMDQERIISRVQNMNRSLWSKSRVCGACEMDRLHQRGIHAVKIVGRTFPGSSKVQDLGFIAAVRDLLAGEPLDHGAFKEQVGRLFSERYGLTCQECCYYP